MRTLIFGTQFAYIIRRNKADKERKEGIRTHIGCFSTLTSLTSSRIAASGRGRTGQLRRKNHAELEGVLHVVERVGAGSAGFGPRLGHQRPHGDHRSARGEGSRSRVRQKELDKGFRVQRRLRRGHQRVSGEDVPGLSAGLGLPDKMRGELLLRLKHI